MQWLANESSYGPSNRVGKKTNTPEWVQTIQETFHRSEEKIVKVQEGEGGTVPWVTQKLTETPGRG